MKNSNRIRVSAALAVVSTLAFFTASWISVTEFEQSVERRFQTMLETSLEARIQELKSYTRSVDNDLRIISDNTLVQLALVDFSRAFAALGENPGAELRRLYLDENPHSADSRHNLVDAGDGSAYSKLHSDYHLWFRNVAMSRDYYDAFLVDAKGNIVYTVFKESDLGSNLYTDSLADSALADVYRKALEGAPGAVVASDFARYEPSDNVPAAFEGMPIRSNGIIAGALIFQLRLDPFNEIMQTSHDLGATAESYLVNSEKLMLSQSLFVEDSILNLEIDTQSATQALSGASGFGVIDDYRGTPVLSAYQPFKWAGGIWAVVAELDVDELKTESTSVRLSLLFAGICTVLVAALVGWFLAER